MKHSIIGIAGPARIGKDTAAIYIRKYIPEYQVQSFAFPIKIMLMEGLGLSQLQVYGDQKETVDERYGKTPRELMQSLGTEWGRNSVTPNIWVNALEVQMNRMQSTLIIPDVRFESEADFVRKHGVLIHIKGAKKIDSSHLSEKGIYIDYQSDIIVQNDGTLDDYYLKLNKMIHKRLK